MYNVSSCRFQFNNLHINLIVSALASFLFFGGWWIVADIDVHKVMEEHKTYYVPAVVATIAYCFTNVIPAHYFHDSVTFQQGCFSPGVARCYLFLWLMISFGSLIGSLYVWINNFVLRPEVYQWPGYGICLQNICIFVSNMLLRFAKKHDHFY